MHFSDSLWNMGQILLAEETETKYLMQAFSLFFCLWRPIQFSFHRFTITVQQQLNFFFEILILNHSSKSVSLLIERKQEERAVLVTLCRTMWGSVLLLFQSLKPISQDLQICCVSEIPAQSEDEGDISRLSLICPVKWSLCARYLSFLNLLKTWDGLHGFQMQA